MDRIQNGQVRIDSARTQDARTAERPSLRDIDKGSVEELRGLVEDGVVDQRQVERRLVEIGRVGDVYEVARGQSGEAPGQNCADDCDGPGKNGKGHAHGHDKEISEEFLASLAISTIDTVRQELVESHEQIAEENRERDIVGTRVVGDRLVFDTASGPAHSMTLSSAELDRIARDAPPPVSGTLDD